MAKEQLNTTDFEAIRISIASPEIINDWSYGEVTKPETINYRTQKPERDGLFDERIFGPIKDYECYCGKYKKIRYKGVVCDKCGVEVTKSSVRRERMGHIELAVPVTHIWYVKGVPSRIGLILDISSRDLEKVIYFGAFIIIELNEDIKQQSLKQIEKEYKTLADRFKRGEKEEVKDKKEVIKTETEEKITAKSMEEIETAYLAAKKEIESLGKNLVISEQKYFDLTMKYGAIVRVGIGAEAVLELLRNFELEAEIKSLSETVKKSPFFQTRKLAKRLKLLRDIADAKIRPEWMVLTHLPVIPPDLRPMVQLDGGRFAASDLNDLYRRVINRNNRLKRLISQGAPEVICRNERRMLQEAVDALIDNSARKDKALTAAGNRRKLRSLSDMLRGKQGRFRQNLLGKRVDYSGRSVIVVGPDLKLNQCGIPKVMALELFKPHVVSKLISEGYAHNVKNATRLIERAESYVWDILEEIANQHYVLLNRAPTLHRLGIQAFKPVLIEGKAIQIHPLVCAAYNADFDGDQMAVYIPLSKKAKIETEEIIRSTHNLLKPASGDPIVTPSADMVLGCYYMTMINDNAIGDGKVFNDFDEAILAHRNGAVGIQAKIKIKITPEIAGKLTEEEIQAKYLETSVGRILFNQVLPAELKYCNKEMDKKNLRTMVAESFRAFGNKKTAELVDKIKEIGFYYASHSGLTFAASDIKIPPKKYEVVAAAKQRLIEIDQQYEKGLITAPERHSKIIDLWTGARGEIEQAMIKGFDRRNPIFSMVISGSRGAVTQLTQVAGMKGLVSSPSGEIIELPVEANFKEGFNEFEYFISTHGARKGRSDTAIRTADAGYLTRRLIDVAQDNIITSEDCGTKNAIEMSRSEDSEMGFNFDRRIFGRFLANKVVDPKTGEIIAKAGQIIDYNISGLISKAEVQSVKVHSPLTCDNIWGVCRKCYGMDLATGKAVQLGSAVGIVAAQAIGEPGTQLTMRTFHIGGVAGEDITQGLPRVDELFEARNPKTPAIISEIAGKISVRELKDQKIISVKSSEKRREVYRLIQDYKSTVKNNEKVKAKQVIAEAPNKKAFRALYDGVVDVKNSEITLVSDDYIRRDYTVSPYYSLKVSNGDTVQVGEQLTEGHKNLHEMMRLTTPLDVQKYIIGEVLEIYASQGQNISDKHIEIIVRQMFSRVKINEQGDSNYLPGQIVDRLSLEESNYKLKQNKNKPATFEPLLLGISKSALSTDSFLSAASFQETTGILIEAATQGKTDKLRGLKENVIIGRLIPAGTGYVGQKEKKPTI